MKKIFFSLLAIAALASCAKTEAVYVEDNSEIKLAPVTSVATKANQTGAIDGTAYPTAENFDVYAYWANEAAGSKFTTATDYLTQGNTGVEFMNKGQFWGGTDTYYWPKNGSLRFAAYSPSSLDMTHVLATDVYTLSDFTYETDTYKTYEVLVAPTSESYTAQTAAEKVSVVFEHALSWLSFEVKSTEAANKVFTVTKVVVDDVKYKGDFTADMLNDTKTWDPTDDVAAITVYANDETTVTTEAVVVESKPEHNGVLVLPQATTTVTLTFTQASINGTPELEGQIVTVPLVLSENEPWEPGKHYTYTVIFDLDEILINPSVEDWVDVNVNDVPATDVVVTTEEEFVAAMKNGGQVRLGADITTTENFYLYESVNLDLAGYTLTANITPEIFVRVNKGATFTIGRGTVVCDDYIVSVNEDGVAVVNEGNYTAGCTAVNVNGGKAYITGGYFEDSTSYDGQYLLNHIDGTNGLIEVTGGSFKNYNPAAAPSENPAMNLVKAGYNVTAEGDVYTVTAADANVTVAEDAVLVGSMNVNNALLDGAGNTLTAEENPTDNGLVCPEGDVVIKNVTIDGLGKTTVDGKGLRGIYITKAGNYVIENVVVTGTTYGINVNTTKDVTLSVKNSTLESWTSYGSTTTATFENVTFTAGSYNTYRPYGATTLTNCEFTGMVIDLSQLVEPIVFDNCTVDGEPLEEADLTDAPAGLVTIQ